METFVKTLTCGSTCINDRLSFNTEFWMPNLTNTDYKKVIIDESFKAYKRDDLNAIYKIKFDNENTYHETYVITKVLKLDENNQYGYAMTKPMPTRYIKEHPLPHGSSPAPFSKESIQMMRLDISLLVISNLMRKELLHASTCIMKFCHLSLKNQKFQSLANVRFTNLQNWCKKRRMACQKTYLCTNKSHRTMFPKKFILLYLEDLIFLIKRCCWKVMKIYTRYTFEQACFKRDLALMNQTSRLNAKSLRY